MSKFGEPPTPTGAHKHFSAAAAAAAAAGIDSDGASSSEYEPATAAALGAGSAVHSTVTSNGEVHSMQDVFLGDAEVTVVERAEYERIKHATEESQRDMQKIRLDSE